MYSKGKGTNKNEEKATFFSVKACKLDNDKSCLHSGNRYKDGTGVIKNKVKANEFYTKACKLENESACDMSATETPTVKQ
jgi:TPR repeat protein